MSSEPEHSKKKRKNEEKTTMRLDAVIFQFIFCVFFALFFFFSNLLHFVWRRIFMGNLFGLHCTIFFRPFSMLTSISFCDAFFKHWAECAQIIVQKNGRKTFFLRKYFHIKHKSKRENWLLTHTQVPPWNLL